jgi:MYXO-CTERM domain-containing protein
VNYTTDPNARISRYQQRVNGYGGTTDSFINGTSGANVGTAVDGSAVEQGFLDGSNATGAGDSYDQPYLVRFDNLDLASPAVTRAELVMRTGFGSDNSGTGGSFAVHRILKPWDTSTTYASLDSDGDATLNAEAELVANGFLAASSTETGKIGNADMLYLDVTDIVQAWKDGAPNYGIYLGSTGTADGWQIFSSGAYGFGSDSNLDGQLAPELDVFYVPPVPEPTGLGLVALGGLTLLRRRRK